MGKFLSDGQIQQLNDFSPAAQNVGLGTLIDDAISGSLPPGSIGTADLADGAVTPIKASTAMVSYTGGRPTIPILSSVVVLSTVALTSITDTASVVGIEAALNLQRTKLNAVINSLKSAGMA